MKFFKNAFLLIFLASFVFAKPVADFTFNPFAGDAPAVVYFDASNSIGNISEYKWVVDGGPALYGEKMAYHFEEGEHRVVLTVTDFNGESDSVEKNFSLDYNPVVYTNLFASVPVFDSESGLYKFEANASENGYCSDTRVFVDVGSYSYEMDKGVDCVYTKYLKLPVGDYVVDYRGVYSDSQRNSFFKLSVDSGEEAYIKVYSPQENTVFKKDAVAYVEAVFVYGVKNIREGTGVVRLVDDSGKVYNEREMQLYYPGAFKAFIPMNVSEGNYSLLVEIKYDGFDLVKKVPVYVSENQSENSIAIGSSIYLVEPGVFEYPLNSTVSFEVNFFDERGLLVSNADALMKISRYNETIDVVNMTKGRFSYEADYFFSEPGDYVITFDLSKGDEKSEKSIVITVGNSTQLAEVENFTAKILSPLPEVYVENSSLNMRALVTYGDERVDNASVKLYLNGEEHEMSYDNYGEYVYSTEKLSSGKYEVKVVADYLDLKAVTEMSFEVSPHVLNLSFFEPDENESIELNKSKGIVLKADLVDEQNYSVPDALVKGSIIEPSGRTISVDFVQNKETGAYEAVFYPNDEGVYKVTASAYYPGFVSAEDELSFKVSFYKEELNLPKPDLESMLIIAIAVAILALVIALFKLIF